MHFAWELRIGDRSPVSPVFSEQFVLSVLILGTAAFYVRLLHDGNVSTDFNLIKPVLSVSLWHFASLFHAVSCLHRWVLALLSTG